jgi:large subunit ribosomal protein L29
MVAVAELRELDDDELETRLAEYRRELLNLRFQLATGQLDNSSRLRQVRKDVARALTVLRRRELGLEEETALIAAPAPARRRRAPRRAEEDVDEVEVLDDEDELDAPADDIAEAEADDIADAQAEDDVEDDVEDADIDADTDDDTGDAGDAAGEKSE